MCVCVCVCTLQKIRAVKPIKLSSDNESEVKYDFGVKTALPLTQRSPAVSYITTRLFFNFLSFPGNIRSKCSLFV